jgi:phosphate transport system permease protein
MKPFKPGDDDLKIPVPDKAAGDSGKRHPTGGITYSGQERSGKLRHSKERAIEVFFTVHGSLAILILLGIFALLLIKTLPVFKEVSLSRFFLSADWNPSGYERETYGLLAMIISTLMVSVGAMIIAIPIGIGCAAYLAEVASPRVRELLKPALELLAGVPSVVVGFLGIVLVGPLVARLTGQSNGLNAINGSLLLAVMALPTIISLSEDAIRAVPESYKEASLALGANRWQTLTRVIIPAGLSGITASIMLGFGRAVGETMTVLMATGNAPALPTRLTDSIRTFTATIAIEMGEVPYNTTHYYALFFVGLVLFAITFLVNLVSDIIMLKHQEAAR